MNFSDMVEKKRVSYEDSRGMYVAFIGSSGTIPNISIDSDTIPSAWELAVLGCWKNGFDRHTHYDRKDEQGNYIDPASKDATIEVRIDNPFNEPMIHKNFPGGIEKLEEYKQEVVDGIHDHWIDPKKWKYTYHERLMNYNPSVDLTAPGRGLLLPSEEAINQIDLIVKRLEKEQDDRGAQATTWMPTADPKMSKDRPCLQRLWFSILKDKNDDYVLNLNSHWRSRDLYKAWPMNVYAMSHLQKKVAEDLSNRWNKPVKIGSYIDISDSLHIYGSYWKDENFKKEINKMETQPIENRVWNSTEPIVVEILKEARANLAKDPDYYAKGAKK